MSEGAKPVGDLEAARVSLVALPAISARELQKNTIWLQKPYPQWYLEPKPSNIRYLDPSGDASARYQENKFDVSEGYEKPYLPLGCTEPLLPREALKRATPALRVYPMAPGASQPRKDSESPSPKLKLKELLEVFGPK